MLSATACHIVTVLLCTVIGLFLVSRSPLLEYRALSGFFPPNITDMDSRPEQGYRTVAYFVNWAIYARKHFPQNLPAEHLTHILYAFANIRPDSGEVYAALLGSASMRLFRMVTSSCWHCSSLTRVISYLTDNWADTDIHWEGDSWNDVGTNLYGCLKQLNLLKKRNRKLKVLLSIGGWTYSSNFKVPASTPGGRATFARTAVELLKNLGFDGLDIDWEYPQDPAEAGDFVALLRACRAALDAYADTLEGRPHFELTVASPAGPANYDRLDLPAMDAEVDFWNLMAYDYAGSWDAHAAHQANLFPAQGDRVAATPFSTERAVTDYVACNVPSHKIVLGMPLYGRAFENTEGPGQPYSGLGEGNWERGVYDYKNLPLPGCAVQEDAEAGASYCFDPVRKVMVSYDTVALARRKAEYIKERGLGGAMWWESSGDKEGNESIIQNVVGVLGGAEALDKKENCVRYPESKYANLRDGFRNN